MGDNRTSPILAGIRQGFRVSTSKGIQDEAFTNPETLPSIEAAYSTFQSIYPKFAETSAVDDLRDREYFHLEETHHVCMDYSGFGLFSYHQQMVNKAGSSFELAYISANLLTHALYGTADVGTAEFCIRRRVMNYLNISDTEYSMVFTASRGSAFKLLAESYPFHLNPNLLTVYDFESEAVNWMAECAKQKGAKIISACFKWPSLRIGTGHLKKLLQETKKKGESARGLFVFPVQSRVTGAKYSYQWLSEAQQNNWHVLLDASSLGPKDMDSLGLSLFKPDFIVSSFYKVFGSDPTGFGCLFIKNTALHTLQNSSRARAVGMVRIVSLNGPEVKEFEEEDVEDNLHERWTRLGQHSGETQSSFSGPFLRAVEEEAKSKQKVTESDHRGGTSSKRSSKMARHNREQYLEGCNYPTEIDNEDGRGVSPQETEDGQEVEQRWRSELCSEASTDSPNECGGAHITFSGRHRDGGANEFQDDDAVDLGRNFVSVLSQFGAEAVEDFGRMESRAVDELQTGSGWDVKDTRRSDEFSQSHLAAKSYQHAIDKVSNAAGLGESSDVLVNGEHLEDNVKRNVPQKSILDVGRSVQARFYSFKTRPSFKKHTGKQFGDFQVMGVQGLVQKFQSLHSEFACHNQVESTFDVKLDLTFEEGSRLVQTADQTPCTSPRCPRGIQNVAESKPMKNSSQDDCSGPFESISSNLAAATNFRTGITLDLEGTGRKILDESGEDNNTTVLLDRSVHNWNKRMAETGIAERSSVSQERLDTETACASVKRHMEHLRPMDNPEKKLTANHAWEEDSFFKPSKSSSNFKLDKNLLSLISPPCHASTTNHLSRKGSSVEDVSLDIADAKGHGRRSGHFDLRNNITSSRDVDYGDELYEERPPGAIDNLASTTQSTTLTKDIAVQEVQDSDEESYIHSQHCGGPRHGYRATGYLGDDLQPATYGEDDIEDEYGDCPLAESRESQLMISCKGLDFADSLGLIKLNCRLRYLINWLLNSLLKLRHPGPNQGVPLVRIYGPKVRYDRGIAVSFNIFDWKGVLIQPGLVQRLAGRSNISLGFGRLCNIIDPEMSSDFMAEKERLLRVDKRDKSEVVYSPYAGKVDAGKCGSAGDPVIIPVVTAAVGFVTSFEDVYKLWSFLANFLDADYASKEVWRYHSLNQQIMVM